MGRSIVHPLRPMGLFSLGRVFKDSKPYTALIAWIGIQLESKVWDRLMSELCLFDKLWFWFLGSYFDNLKGWVDFFHHNLISRHSKGDKTTIFGDYFEAVKVVLLPIFSISVMKLCRKSALNQGLSGLWVGSLCTLRGQWDFFIQSGYSKTQN